MICPNCGNQHTFEFCSLCGQRNVDLHAPIGGLVMEVVEETLGFDSRVRHTLLPFFFKPGEVTRDYLSGRRVRYTSPLKMYLVAAAVFFFAFTLHPHERFVQIDPKDRAALTTEPPKEGRFSHLMRGQALKLDKMDKEEGTKQIAANMANMLPKALVVLLPIFALLLKLFWRKRYYAEHIVFSLHYHAFALLLLALPGFIPGKAGDNVRDVAILICFIYLFLALRRVYGNGRLLTFAKLLGLSSLYTFALCIGLAAAGLASVAFL
jgi:Protein of unknown function (DUF3667)